METCSYCAKTTGMYIKLALEGFWHNEEFVCLQTRCPNCNFYDAVKIPKVWWLAVSYHIIPSGDVGGDAEQGKVLG